MAKESYQKALDTAISDKNIARRKARNAAKKDNRVEEISNQLTELIVSQNQEILNAQGKMPERFNILHQKISALQTDIYESSKLTSELMRINRVSSALNSCALIGILLVLGAQIIAENLDAIILFFN